MDRIFEDRVALVTGASGGIGGAVARAFAASGARVAAHYFRNRVAAEALVAEINIAGGRAIAIGGDVADPDDAAGIAERTAAALGSIDILVNNSGTIQNLPFGSVTPQSFHEQFSANVLGMIMMTQAVAPHFPASGARVVNVASNLAYNPLPGTAVYSAAKAAIITLTHCFARELGPLGVTVNAVAPGATDTQMVSWLTDEMRAEIALSTPLGRMGRPDDAAEVVLFLASPAARWVTGRTLIVDGGLI
jgi:3-oxoacyl-[acyl-carrier protein] reductase